MTEWLIEARRVAKSGAPVCLFIDWRQLPNLTDALQWAGWIWRGVLVWDKTNSRPQRGRFRQQAEFVVWGSNGHMPLDRNAPVLPGVFRQAMPPFSKRIHQTEKPLTVMRDMIKIVEPDNIILDPFAGAGTTILAAKLEGYPAVGIELSEYYASAGAKRIENEGIAA
jgi:site-specific DNA-methyltransferase (adenine-specific)